MLSHGSVCVCVCVVHGPYRRGRCSSVRTCPYVLAWFMALIAEVSGHACACAYLYLCTCTYNTACLIRTQTCDCGLFASYRTCNTAYLIRTQTRDCGLLASYRTCNTAYLIQTQTRDCGLFASYRTYTHGVSLTHTRTSTHPKCTLHMHHHLPTQAYQPPCTQL